MARDLKTLVGIGDHPPRVCLMGKRGDGKTETATGAPKPFFFNLEKSRIRRNLGPGNQAPETYAEVLDFIDSLLTQEHDYKSVIIDTVDTLEAMMTDHICKVNGYKNINQTEWGVGLSKRDDEWRRFLGLLDKLNERGMYIILVGHTIIQEMRDPLLPTFDRYDLKLHKRTGPIVLDWTDLNGFCMIKCYSSENGERKTATTVGERVICCQPNPAYEAKTRYGGIPNEIPMDWNVLEDYMRKGAKLTEPQPNRPQNKSEPKKEE
jgi:hypothetical protein